MIALRYRGVPSGKSSPRWTASQTCHGSRGQPMTVQKSMKSWPHDAAGSVRSRSGGVHSLGSTAPTTGKLVDGVGAGLVIGARLLGGGPRPGCQLELLQGGQQFRPKVGRDA